MVTKKTKSGFLPHFPSAALPQSFRTAGFFKGAFKIGSRSASRRGNSWISLQCQFWNVMHCAPPGATYNVNAKPQHPFPRPALLPELIILIWPPKPPTPNCLNRSSAVLPHFLPRFAVVKMEYLLAASRATEWMEKLLHCCLSLEGSQSKHHPNIDSLHYLLSIWARPISELNRYCQVVWKLPSILAATCVGKSPSR